MVLGAEVGMFGRQWLCAVCCKIPIGFTFLVQAHLGSPGQRAVKRVCVCAVCSCCMAELGTGQVVSCVCE